LGNVTNDAQVTVSGNQDVNGRKRFIWSIGDSTYDSHFGGTDTAGSIFAHHSTGGAPSDSPTGTQATVLHMGTPWGRTQIVGPNNADELYFRTGTRTSWSRVWHTNNINSNWQPRRTVHSTSNPSGGNNGDV